MDHSCQPSSRSLASLLEESAPSLGTLTREARRLQRVQDVVRDVLGPPLGERVQVASAGPETLVLVVESPAWAARLRFRAAELVPNLRGALDEPRLRSVRVKVSPPRSWPNQSSSATARRAVISVAAASLLREVADGVEDERLAHVLRSLADRSGA